ncbi:MAG: tRNA uridine(34) 5-carboxymethylaminomethyl modification radical SAM/GNAT enzyme Elp3 [Candidatus Nitrosocosmicus sp.]
MVNDKAIGPQAVDTFEEPTSSSSTTIKADEKKEKKEEETIFGQESKEINLHNKETEQYYKACKEISDQIISLDVNNLQSIKKEMYKIIKDISSQYKLSKIPKNMDILKNLPQENPLKGILKLKPSKTLSGIAVITVMPMPFECPHGKCIYCPGGVEVNTPLSYVGSEPATKIAQNVNYDPFNQVWTKLSQLAQRGHDIDKAELVIVGGTFPFYPLEYQKYFVNRCYDALNSFDVKAFFDKYYDVFAENKKNKYNNNNIQTDASSSSSSSLLSSKLTLEGNSVSSEKLERAKKDNETALIRCVGLTVETKPDYCKTEHLNTMLQLGTTRVEIGVQSLNDSVLKAVNRGHTTADIFEAFYLAKNCGYKIVAHMMPGLPQSSLKHDIADFKKLFEDERLKPDMLKIYPTLVLRNTGLYKLYEQKKYDSYLTEDLVKILVEIKKIIPPWARIMRIQREIETKDIISGPNMGNLRQLVLGELNKQGLKCKCIRCREIGLNNTNKEYTQEDIKLFRIEYYSSGGKEIFLSYELKDNTRIFGFLRLRLMSDPQRKELSEGDHSGEGYINNNNNNNRNSGVNTTTATATTTATTDTNEEKKWISAIIRELHVYGPLVKIKNGSNMILQKKEFNNGRSSSSSIYRKDKMVASAAAYQHKGLGQNLLREAERICKEEYNLKKLSVISAVGTREYYKKFGYIINGPYVTKSL